MNNKPISPELQARIRKAITQKEYLNGVLGLAMLVLYLNLN